MPCGNGGIILRQMITPQTEPLSVSVVHAVDARVKIALLAVFSVGVIFVTGWPGMLLYAGFLSAIIAASQLEWSDFARYLPPVVVICLFTMAFNVIRFEGGLYLDPAGLQSGAVVAARILMLVLGSLTLCNTTDPTQLLQAFRSILSPLRRVGVPANDAATVLTLAVRFIPVLFDEFQLIRAAQLSRGSGFEGAGLWKALRAYGNMLIPLFVGLFRHADRLAVAMDSRAYGANANPTSLHTAKLSAEQIVFLLLGCAVIVAVAVVW